MRRLLPSQVPAFFAMLLAASLACLPTPSLHAEAALTDAKVSFYKEIRPILQAHCQGCHQPAKARGNYVMTDHESLLRGGDEGNAITPGKPQESYLIEEITPHDGKADMPKGKDPLPAEEFALLQRWIAEGAVDDTPENARARFTQENPPVYKRPPVVTSLDYSPDGTLLAVSGFHEVLLHQADGSGLVARLVGLSARIESVAFSPDGAYLAVTGGLPARMGEVQIWDVAQRKLHLSVPVTYDTVYGASWSPDSRQIAFGGADNTVRIIEAETGVEVLYQGSHNDWVFDTVFSKEGTHLVSVGRDMTAKLTEVATQRFVDNVTSITPGALKGGIASVDRHPLRDEILVGGSDGVPKIYKMFRTTKREIGDDANLLQELPPLQGRVFSVAFSRDGRRIAAGSSLDGKGSLHIYGIDPESQPSEEITAILVKPTHTRSEEETSKLQKYFDASSEVIAAATLNTGVYAVAISADNATVAAAGSDGVVRLFDAISGAEKGEFTPVPIARHDEGDVAQLEVQPAEIALTNPFAYAQVLVTAELTDGTRTDVTREAAFSVEDDEISVSKAGMVRARADGEFALSIRYAGKTAKISVVASGVNAPFVPDYLQDVNPVVSKLGCNAGTCHGSKDGKNGFKLSLRGYDPIYDLRSLSDDVASRRMNVAAPDSSLMLLKATAAVPHEGGQLMKPGSDYYRILEAWIADGAELELDSPRVSSIALLPENPVVQREGDQQQMRVIATFADGRRRDVTAEAYVDSGNTEVVTTDKTGLVTMLRRGEAPILARYEGAYASTIVTVMGDRSGFVWEEPAIYNPIDRFVADKLKRMKTLSSGACTDIEFIRRIYLDLTGLPPSADVVRSFMADERSSREKREAVIDELIGNEPFIAHWSNKWADLLQVNRKFLGTEGAARFREWIRQEVAANTPYDAFARKVLTASGSNKENPAASYYKIHRTPEDTMENTTHLFLAVRFNCNKCHDHPFERWTQDNYYEMAAFFGQTGLKPDPASGDAKIGGTAVEGGKPLYEIVYDKEEGEVMHERTQSVIAPSVPYPTRHDAPEEATRRERLASWITSEDNRYFAASYVNRIWGYLTGTGLIEPLDDIRAGNPPSNPELLDWLTNQFIESGMDTRALIRLICQSHTYQLSIETNAWNADDTINYSHAKARRLPAEVLYDAIHMATGARSKFPEVEPGTRAAQLPDVGISLPDGFLDNLGRPARESACECERSSGLQLGSIMALVSGPTLGDAISDPENAIARLSADIQDNRRLVEELYMRLLNRIPSEPEIEACLQTFAILNEEDRQLAADLEAYREYYPPIHAQRVAEREQGIATAKKALAAYEAELAPKLAKLDAEQQARTEQLEQELAGYEADLQSRLPEWEAARVKETRWTVLEPRMLDAPEGTLLHVQGDNAILASGNRSPGTYSITAGTGLTKITGFKLEALPHDSLPNKGPGRADDGNFVLTEFEARAHAPTSWEALPVVQTWDLADPDTAAEWVAGGTAKTTRGDGALEIVSEGDDPYITVDGLSGEAGAYLVEIDARFAGSAVAQLFWSTSQEPSFAEARSVKQSWSDQGERSATYRFVFSTEAPLTSLRLDPRQAEGSTHVESIRLRQGSIPQGGALTLQNAQATFSQSNFEVAKAIDGNRNQDNGWALSPQLGQAHAAVFEVKDAFASEPGAVVTLDLHQNFSGNQFELGHFRLAATDAEPPLTQGLPEHIGAIAGNPADQRSPEEQGLLFTYVKTLDDTWNQKKAALEENRKPRPEDPGLVERREALKAAEQPLTKDATLARLERDVALSHQQLETARLTAAQDIAWALINTPAFIFNH